MLLKVIFFVLLYFLKALIYATVWGEKPVPPDQLTRYKAHVRQRNTGEKALALMYLQ